MSVSGAERATALASQIRCRKARSAWCAVEEMPISLCGGSGGSSPSSGDQSCRQSCRLEKEVELF